MSPSPMAPCASRRVRTHPKGRPHTHFVLGTNPTSPCPPCATEKLVLSTLAEKKKQPTLALIPSPMIPRQVLLGPVNHWTHRKIIEQYALLALFVPLGGGGYFVLVIRPFVVDQVFGSGTSLHFHCSPCVEKPEWENEWPGRVRVRRAGLVNKNPFASRALLTMPFSLCKPFASSPAMDDCRSLFFLSFSFSFSGPVCCLYEIVTGQ